MTIVELLERFYLVMLEAESEQIFTDEGNKQVNITFMAAFMEPSWTFVYALLFRRHDSAIVLAV